MQDKLIFREMLGELKNWRMSMEIISPQMKSKDFLKTADWKKNISS